MNIEGANLSSLLPGNNTTEAAGVQSFPEDGAIPESFSNALMGQIELLSEANVQAELAGPLQNITVPQTVNNGTDIGDLLKHRGNEQELAVLFDKYLPLANEKNETVDLNEDVDIEATLLALTDSLKTITQDKDATNPVSASDEVATAQNMSFALTDALKPITPSVTPDEGATAQNTSPALTDALKPITSSVIPDEGATAQNTSPALTDTLKLITPSVIPNEGATTQNTSPALTDVLKPITPSVIPDEGATIKNMSNVMTSNGLYFVKPLTEDAKLNMLGGENVASGDFLQREAVFRQSIQNEQGFNLQSLENIKPAEKTLVIEKQAAILGIEQATPGVSSDLITLHRQVDNKTDSQAITRPLTHPGWSKDLGEQIVWMNNKAIPAAEIRLNPAHLGPISVRIDVNQDQATILFTAQHTEVKEAIEASIPKLREMLGTQQLNLVNVNISQNSTADQGRSQSQTFAKTPGNHKQGIEGVTDTIEKNEHDRVVVSKGLLSLYA